LILKFIPCGLTDQDRVQNRRHAPTILRYISTLPSRRKTCPNATLSTIKLTMTGVGLSPEAPRWKPGLS